SAKMLHHQCTGFSSAPIRRSQMRCTLTRGRIRAVLRRFPSALLLVFATLGPALPGCDDPTFTEPPPFEEVICGASVEWITGTPARPGFPRDVLQYKPLPHPGSDCPFYRGGWQNFLTATQPDATGRPAFLDYPTIDTIFEPHPTGPRSYLGDIKQ